MLKEGHKINIESNGKRQQTKHGSNRCKHYGNDSDFSGRNCGFFCFHATSSKFISKFNKQNSVFNNDTCKSDDAHTKHDAGNGHSGDRIAQEHANDREEYFCQYYKWFAQ